MDPTVGLSETDAVGARRAVELGWVTQADVEQAITAQRQDPSTRLIDHLPLDPRQHGMLAEASTGPIPPEAAAAMDLPENRFGRYWKIRAVGAGGMGEVWLAWDETLRRRVALKFLRRPEEGEAADNLLREARLAGGLEHPNIAKVYEVGDVDGLPYIAMQFIDGRTLGEAAKDLKLPETIAAVTRVAEAVRAAHEQRVIHRDIKPANVMIDGKGHVFVMDFGLAKERPVEGWTLGASNVIAGTPQFMAPEQTHGRADEQSDIYSIGAVLYSLTTGRPPFVGETTLDILIQVRDREPVWPRKLAPSLPADVEAIILRALEKEKARRYRNATELIEDLEAFSNGNPLRHARRPTLGYVLAKKIRKHRAAWALSGALVVAVLAAVVWVSLVRLSARNREAALKQISALSASITERKREMRSGRVDAEEALASLRSAVGAVDRYVRDWPDEPNAYYVRARGLVNLGEYAAAERDLERALSLEPEFHPAWSLLGIVKVEQYQGLLPGPAQTLGQRRTLLLPLLEEAMAAFERGWTPGLEQEQAERWGVAWRREDEIAMKVAESWRALYDVGAEASARVLYEAMIDFIAEDYQVMLAIFEPDPDRKIALLNQALEEAPGFPKTYFVLGLTAWQEGDTVEALRNYDEAVRLLPTYGAALFGRAQSRQAQGDVDGALEDYDRLIEMSWNLGMVYGSRGTAWYDKADYRKAIESYGAGIRQQPELSLNWSNRGNAYSDLGDQQAGGRPDEAEEAWRLARSDYDRYLEMEPDDAEANARRASVRLSLGDIEGSLADADRAVALDPERDLFRFTRGRIRYAAGRVNGAIEDLTWAIELNQEYALAYIHRGAAYLAAGRFLDAIADYSQASDLDPEAPEPYNNQGHARLALGQQLDESGRTEDALRQWRLAQADLDRAIEKNPNYFMAHRNRSLARMFVGDSNGALRDLSRAIEIEPWDLEVHELRGGLRLEQSDYSGAALDLRKVLELAPPDWPGRARIELMLEGLDDQ